MARPAANPPTARKHLPGQIGAAVVVWLMAAIGVQLWPWTAWADGFVATVSLVLLTAAVATVVATLMGSVLARRAVAVGLFGFLGVLLVGRLGGYQLAMDIWPDLRFVALLLAAVVATIAGLVARRTWARWLGLGLATAGAVSAAMNLLSAMIEPAGWRMWILGAFTTGCSLVIVNLVGDVMRADDHADRRSVWNARSPLVGWLRAAIVAGFVAVPMLLLYAWMQPGHIDSMTTPAVFLAGFLAGGTWLTVRGKVIGALVLAAGGAGLLALCGSVFGLASTVFERSIASYYALFWLPSALTAIVSGGMLARPVWKALLGDAPRQ